MCASCGISSAKSRSSSSPAGLELCCQFRGLSDEQLYKVFKPSLKMIFIGCEECTFWVLYVYPCLFEFAGELLCVKNSFRLFFFSSSACCAKSLMYFFLSLLTLFLTALFAASYSFRAAAFFVLVLLLCSTSFFFNFSYSLSLFL